MSVQEANYYGVSNSSIFYANMIVEGVTNFGRCPKKLRSDVAFILVVLGQDDLVTDLSCLNEAKERYTEFQKNHQN